MAAAFLVVFLPWLSTMAALSHQGLRSGGLVNFAVLHIHEATYQGFAGSIPTPLHFLREHPWEVLAAIGRKLISNLYALVLSLGSLLLLPVVALAARGPARPDGPVHGAGVGRNAAAAQTRRIWMLLALANFAFYTTSWAAAGAVRYLLPSTALLLPLLLAGFPQRSSCAPAPRCRFSLFTFHFSLLTSLAPALLAGTLLLSSGHWNAHRMNCQRRWAPAGWERYRVGAAWLQTAAGIDDVVASNNPWMVSYLTRRPAVACPRFRGRADIDRFVRVFGVRWVLLFAGQSDVRLLRCRRHPALRLVRAGRDRQGRRAYLFRVSSGTTTSVNRTR